MKNSILALAALTVVSCSTPVRSPHATPELTTGIIPPRVIYRVEPEYPAKLRSEHVTGVVTIGALIEKSGRLRSSRVLQSTNPRLDALALAAVRRWRFSPGTINGEAADVFFQVAVKFSIP